MSAGSDKNGSPVSTVVVLGTGSIGQRHLSVIQELLLSAIAVPVRASRLPELRAQGYRTARDLTEACRAGDSVIICTETSRHFDDIRASLACGCDVLVEKPVSATADGLAEIEQVASRTGRQVFVGCTLRFAQGMRLFRDCLPKIGAVHSVRIECQSYLPSWRPGRDYRQSYSARSADGGVLRDLIHEIDYAVWLFGRPDSVFCHMGNSGRLEIAAEESADLFWTTASGASVSTRLDYVTRVPRRRMRAFGALGDLEWDAQGQTVTLAISGQPEQRLACPMERNQMLADQMTAFISAKEGGPSGNLATFAEGAFATALCDAARRSSTSKTTEPIHDWRSL